MDGFQLLCRTEGIIPALESAHAVAHAAQLARVAGPGALILVNHGSINVSDPFKALTGLSSVKAEAMLDTLEFVVFVIPNTGQAQVVAAQEHLVAATGT